MSDLESYLNHCYDKLLQESDATSNQPDSELCACSKLIERNETNTNQ